MKEIKTAPESAYENEESVEEQMRALSELFYLDSRRYSPGLGGEE